MSAKKAKTGGARRTRAASRTVVIASVALAVPAAAAVAFFGWKVKQASDAGDRAAEHGAQYDAGLTPVPPDNPLMKWRELGEVATGFDVVRGVSQRPDGLYVVAGDQAVRVLSQEGAKTLEIPLTGRPQAVAVDGDGTFFVGMKDHVEVFGADGKSLASWPSLGEQAVITCVSVSSDHVYVADAKGAGPGGGGLVRDYDKTGKLLRELGRTDESKHVRGLIVPSPHLDVAAASDGTVWITNPGRHCLEGYDASGTVVRMWGEEGTSIQAFPGCCNPTDFALFRDGRFVTAEKGVPRVKVYTKDGTLDSVVAGPDKFAADKMEGATAMSLDVMVDHKGRVVVLDPVARTVRIYVPK